jgi:two-component sensor histidine kinase
MDNIAPYVLNGTPPVRCGADVTSDPVELSSELASTLEAELVTNSFKHAYGERTEVGDVGVSFKRGAREPA